MDEPSLKPLGYGKMLDRCFHLYRRHFVKLLQLSLLLYAPFFVLQSILIGQNGTGFSVWSFIGDFEKRFSTLPEPEPIGGAAVAGYIVLLLIFMLTVIPLSMAASVRLVESANRGDGFSLGGILRPPLRRLGALAGSTFLYGLILFGIVFGVSLIFGAIGVAAALTLGQSFGLDGVFLDSPGRMAGLVIVGIVIYVVVLCAIGLLIGFFGIRWGFYAPYAASREEGVGLSASWRLTRGQFWRLFAVYITMSVAVSVVSLIPLLVPNETLQLAAEGLVQVVTMPLYLVAYGVAYHDLRLRQGAGLETMLERVEAPASGQDWPERSFEEAGRRTPDADDAGENVKRTPFRDD